jgi:DNA-binding winged helix-turn-helix (wHTH) protein
VLHVVEFGAFTIDGRAFELRHKGRRVRISVSLLKLLVLFVEHPGELITRDQIVACLWDKPEYVDVDSGINTAVNRLRLILGDNSANPVYLETVVGAGYRFKMPVQQVPDTDLPKTPSMPSTEIPAVDPAPAEPQTMPATGNGHLDSAVQSAPAVQAVETQPTKRRLGVRGFVPVAGLALLGIFLIAWHRHSGRQVGAQPEDPPALFSEATFNGEGNPVTTQAISHNGQWIAYSDSRGLFSRDLRSAVILSLSMPAGFKPERLTWQADDHAVLLSGVRTQDNASMPEVWLVPLTGGAATLLVRGGSDAVASPDGTHLAYVAAHGTELWLTNPAGASPHRLRKVDPEYHLRSLEWAPASDRLILDDCQHPFLSDPEVDLQGNPPKHCSYESIDAASGTILASQPETYFDSAFVTADGRFYFSRDVLAEEYSRAGLFMVSTDKISGRFLSAPRLVLRLPGDGASGISASDEGQLMSALIRRRSSLVFVGDLSLPGPRLSHIQQLDHMAPDNYPHSWTPGNKQVVFESNDTGDYAIYLQGVDGSAAHLLARSPQSAALPRLSPDHRFILFENFVFKPGSFADSIFQVPSTGGEIQRFPLRGAIEDFDCPQSRNAVQDAGCVVRERTGNDFSFFRFDLLHGEGQLVLKMPASGRRIGNWGISSDGKEIAIPNQVFGQPEIQLVSLSQKDPTPQTLTVHLKTPGAVLSAGYSPNGDGFYAQVRTGVGYELVFINRAGRTSLLRQTSVPIWGIPSSDGKKLAFLDQVSNTNAWVGTLIDRENSVNLEQPIRYASLRSILEHRAN